MPQVVYYVYAYASLLRQGQIQNKETINVVVPTGNFGNILAAYYAKQMGVPIGKNLSVLPMKIRYCMTFSAQAAMTETREFMLTNSPSMDILISSNLERLIYRIAGNDAEKNRNLMENLAQKGHYEITEDMKAALGEFYGNYASEEETAEAIKNLYVKNRLRDGHSHSGGIFCI